MKDALPQRTIFESQTLVMLRPFTGTKLQTDKSTLQDYSTFVLYLQPRTHIPPMLSLYTVANVQNKFNVELNVEAHFSLAKISFV